MALSVGELSEHRGVRECMQWFTREKQWINEMHLQLCRIPAPTFCERERAQWFTEQLRGLGWQASLDRAGNVIAAEGEGPYIAITAHLDTVIAPRNKDEITVGPDGRFHGPGVSDNGAGLAALLALARAWRAAGSLPQMPSSPLLVANVGEEGEGNLLGMRHLCKSPVARKIDAFLVVDGADTEHVTTRGLGSRRFEVAFAGPGGHSWSDYGVANPLHALCRAVALFSDTRLDSAPKSALNVGLIEGGSSVNAIPQLARAKVDIRSENNEKMESLVELLSAAAERARDIENQRASSGKVTVRLREIGSRPAAALPEDSPLFDYVRAVDGHLGIRSHFDISSTDANIPLSMGIPAIAVGGGGAGGGAHTTQEWYRPEARDLGLKRIFLTFLLMLQSGVTPGSLGAGRSQAAPEPRPVPAP
ncbi:MAG TPA: M20/M25/M40 family metallo-hydrolase [Bryobacteraceae bacterium]|jgi:acetylornithine deacetylase/succinyl-diaminopimelate desuccinylase-like protein|nr:M20/M25/M40 family metallo-hydrolase [Bryobacteraceae bacterium]